MTAPLLFIDGKSYTFSHAEPIPNNAKGLYLSEYEFTILQQIYLHRMVEASRVHILFKIERSSMRANSITNRLAKLVEYKILKRKQSDTKSIRYRKYYYYIGEVGYEILRKYHPFPMGAYSPKDWKIPNAHNESCTNAIIEAHSANALREQPFNIRYERGSHHELIRERANLNGWVIPDYILQHENLLMCIEYDTGTEPVGRITEKSKIYAGKLELLKQKGYRLAIIYLKSSSNTGKSSIRRIQSMKAAHETIYKQIRDIPIYVVDEADLYTIVEKLCLGMYPYQYEQTLSIILKAELLERLNNKQAKALRSNSIGLSEMLLEKKDEFLFPENFIFRADQFFEHRGTVKTVVYCAGEIGSVHTYIHLRIANSIFAKANESLLMTEVSPIELLVTYEGIDNTQLIKEVLGIPPRLDIRLQTSLEVEFVFNLLFDRYGTANLENMFGDPIQRLKSISAFKMIWEEHK
ncbi:replication-relaxation family protein [Solibacillus sp. FSL W7-1436]|uniref:replication-relaxation family protein n=1 Tax=Solibacillus sp. FSL W7-1436 TaxID=2921705 RepID=UPI0030F7C12D